LRLLIWTCMGTVPGKRTAVAWYVARAMPSPSRPAVEDVEEGMQESAPEGARTYRVQAKAEKATAEHGEGAKVPRGGPTIAHPVMPSKT